MANISMFHSITKFLLLLIDSVVPYSTSFQLIQLTPFGSILVGQNNESVLLCV